MNEYLVSYWIKRPGGEWAQVWRVQAAKLFAEEAGDIWNLKAESLPAAPSPQKAKKQAQWKQNPLQRTWGKKI
jgi:hypothetical protein